MQTQAGCKWCRGSNCYPVIAHKSPEVAVYIFVKCRSPCRGGHVAVIVFVVVVQPSGTPENPSGIAIVDTAPSGNSSTTFQVHTMPMSLLSKLIHAGRNQFKDHAAQTLNGPHFTDIHWGLYGSGLSDSRVLRCHGSRHMTGRSIVFLSEALCSVLCCVFKSDDGPGRMSTKQIVRGHRFHINGVVSPFSRLQPFTHTHPRVQLWIHHKCRCCRLVTCSQWGLENKCARV